MAVLRRRGLGWPGLTPCSGETSYAGPANSSTGRGAAAAPGLSPTLLRPHAAPQRRISRSSMADFDLAIIGGGINGVGIARDAAGRGLKVLLVEQNDLASGTSSASTKLIHGGLRYLEHGAFRLVHEALVERDVLLRIAPHIVRPMRFILPVSDEQRPPWMIKLGLAGYDWLR